VGNAFHQLGRGLQIDNKEYRDLVLAANTVVGTEDGIVDWNDSCSADSVTLTNNLIFDTTGRHIELPSCDNHTLDDNLMFNPGGGFNLRIAGQNYTDAATLNAEAFASANLDQDPQLDGLVPTDGSPAIDAGASLEAIYAELEAQLDASIRNDAEGTPRPSGASEDVGAFEHP
jgi:hypothetical protein